MSIETKINYEKKNKYINICRYQSKVNVKSKRKNSNWWLQKKNKQKIK